MAMEHLLYTCANNVGFCHSTYCGYLCTAGDDLLRSKSLDRDSYNSGDHFNRMDWTGQDNNFGVGLPIASKNYGNWGHKRRLLANPMLKPTPVHIQTATAIFQLMLQIR